MLLFDALGVSGGDGSLEKAIKDECHSGGVRSERNVVGTISRTGSCRFSDVRVSLDLASLFHRYEPLLFSEVEISC